MVSLVPNPGPNSKPSHDKAPALLFKITTHHHKAPGPKTNHKKEKNQNSHQKKVQVWVIAQHIPTTPSPTAPVKSIPIATTPTVATTSTQMPVVKSAATSILVAMYNLAKGKFNEVPYQTERPQSEINPSIQNSNPPPLEVVPNPPTFQVREDTPWPNTEPASTNLFVARADWPIPHTPGPTKTEVPPQTAVITCAMVMPKQVVEKCTWGLHCPICIKEEEEGQKIGMATGREISPKISIHKTLSTPSHMMSLTGTLNRSG